MTAIIVAPDLELCLVQRDGVFTVPAEDCLVRCNCPMNRPCGGILIRQIAVANRKFELLAHDMEQRFLDRQQVRGYELVNNELRLHGPFWSYDFNAHLADVGSSVWGEAVQPDKNGDEHPENALPFVFERDETAFAPYRDYIIVGQFLKRAVITEVIVPDGD